MQALTRPRRSPLLITVVVLAILSGLLLAAAGLVTEVLWFRSLSAESVFTTQLGARVALFLLGALLLGGSVAANMLIAWRLRPQTRRRGASAVLDRYRDLLGENLRTAVLVPSLVLGFMAGASAATGVLPVLAWLNRTPSGVIEPTFGLDTSFFLFDYPVLSLAASTLMLALVFGLMAALAVHFAVGNIAPGRPRGTALPPGMGRHLSVLAALLLLVHGGQNLLERYGFLVSNGTLFTGLHFTDDHARLNAKLIVAVISFLVAALFLVNAAYPRPIVPLAGVVLMLVASLVLGLGYPTVVQAFNVKPNEPDKEAPYIAAHMEATRKAYGIDDVQIQDYEAVTNVQPGQLKEDAEALPGIRLMDPTIVGTTFEQLQQVRNYYVFPDEIDVDRYTIDGRETDVVVAVRELNQAGIPDRNWNNLHTVYTHGHGLVVAYGNRRQGMGDPVWITRDIPPQGAVSQEQSRVYYGEQSTDFAIVGRNAGQVPIELDSPGGAEGGGESYNTYDGRGGVPIGNIALRALYSARFSDLNILLSDRVNESSRILYDRTPQERVQKMAPWLRLDENLYPAIVDGRLVWIVDAYTTSNTYPNSQRVSIAGDGALGRPDDVVNYMRNSVKAVVDAYDGTVNLYAWDDQDPVLASYAKAFPGTIQPKSAASADLMAHVRYPEDLFRVQREVLGRYHVTSPGVWYGSSDLWQIPPDPVKAGTQAKEPPYYLSIKWPGDEAPVFSLTSVFVPSGRANLAAYLAVNADAATPDFGKLRILRMSGTHQIDGPGQTQNEIERNQAVQQRLLPYKQSAGALTYGNLLTLPMGNGLLYVEPIFTQRSGSAGSYPALTFVVVRFGSSVGIGTTLQEALDQVFAGDAGAETGEGSTPGQNPAPVPTPAPTVTPAPGGVVTSAPAPAPVPTGPVDEVAAVAALQRAQESFTAAETALRNGDLATYQAKTNEARAALADAVRAMGR